jgi:hypothetical protein
VAYHLELSPQLSDVHDVFHVTQLKKYLCVLEEQIHMEDCHTRFLCQNKVLIVCMTQDQLFHTYGPKVFTDNQMSRIKYNYYINIVSKD